MYIRDIQIFQLFCISSLYTAMSTWISFLNFWRHYFRDAYFEELERLNDFSSSEYILQEQ
jgi:hypothetical protein